ncbi:hypothetical protein F4604DRAFT_1674284 [Suillus subluteus]|nr:hypothetical protein F4604DRAFT_1674284 [Suillus subluteus]
MSAGLDLRVENGGWPSKNSFLGRPATCHILQKWTDCKGALAQQEFIGRPAGHIPHTTEMDRPAGPDAHITAAGPFLQTVRGHWPTQPDVRSKPAGPFPQAATVGWPCEQQLFPRPADTLPHNAEAGWPTVAETSSTAAGHPIQPA